MSTIFASSTALMAIHWLFLCGFIMFGFLFGIRITHQMMCDRVIDDQFRQKILILLVISQFIAVILLPKRSVYLLFCLGICTTCIFLSRFYLRHRRQKHFQLQFSEFLERVILHLSSGKSLRHAFKESTLGCDAFTQHQLDQILDFVFFSQQSNEFRGDSFTKSMVDELRRIDQSQHRSLQRLKSLHRNLKIESDFRQKSVQVLRRLRIQAYLMTGLYLALLVFVLRTFSFKGLEKVVFSSVTIFVTGLFWILYGGRKIKWKV